MEFKKKEAPVKLVKPKKQVNLEKEITKEFIRQKEDILSTEVIADLIFHSEKRCLDHTAQQIYLLEKMIENSERKSMDIITETQRKFYELLLENIRDLHSRLNLSEKNVNLCCKWTFVIAFFAILSAIGQLGSLILKYFY